MNSPNPLKYMMDKMQKIVDEHEKAWAKQIANEPNHLKKTLLKSTKDIEEIYTKLMNFELLYGIRVEVKFVCPQTNAELNPDKS